MDEAAMLYQMAWFDFSKPIFVTITFEDDEYLCKDEIEIVDIHSQDCLNIEDSCEMKSEEYNTTLLNEKFQNDVNVAETEQTLLNTENNLNTVNDTHTQIQTTNDANSSDIDLVRKDNVESVNNPNTVVNTNSTYETRKTSISDSEIYQYLTDGDELNSHLQKKLDKISDHLVRIMMPYYKYSDNSQRRNYLNLKRWDDMKIHYFDLSYIIVVTLMLPREKNSIFIKKFLDRTLTRASCLHNCKFEPRHVKPFYNDLIVWSKQRREKEKAQRLQNVTKNIRTQNKINNRKNLKMLKGNKGNKKKIRKKNINKDTLADNCINYKRNGMNNKMNQDKNNEINYNNECDGRIIRDQRKEINDTNSINTRLIDNGINVNGIHRTKDISNTKYVSVIVENTGNCNSIDNRIKNAKTGQNENKLINENRTLAARLAGPPQPLNFSHLTVTPIPSLNLNSNNSTCVFSAGDPGREIITDISSNVLLGHAKKQHDIQKIQNLVNRIQSKENHVLDPPNSQLAPSKQRPNNISSEPEPRPPGPPYSSSAHNILTPAAQNYNYNIGEAPNNSQMTQNQTQRNLNAYSASEHNNWNSRQMNNMQVEQQATTTSVPNSSTPTKINTSQNHNTTTRRITGLCNFCGKPTYKICTKCNKISYCSKICQDLHTNYVARLRPMTSNK